MSLCCVYVSVGSLHVQASKTTLVGLPKIVQNCTRLKSACLFGLRQARLDLYQLVSDYPRIPFILYLVSKSTLFP